MAARLTLHRLHFDGIIIHRIQMVAVGNIHILVVVIGDQKSEPAIRLVYALQDRPRLIR